MKKILYIILSIGFTIPSFALGGQQPPSTISYQGILTDENSEIVSDGNYTATFKYKRFEDKV